MKNNALLYLRVSHDEQVKFGASLDAQLNDLENYCHENVLNIKKVYKDEGISGYSLDKRLAFKSMISESNNGDIILFTKLDRFSRNLLDANIVVKELEEKGVSIKAIHEDDIDTTTADGKFIFNLKLSLAERERNKTSERIRDVNRYKDSIGEVTSGSVPLGYKIENKHLVIDDSKKEEALFIFEEFIRCGSLNSTHRKYCKKYGYKNISNFRKLLTNTKYIGEHNGNKFYCEPLISREMFSQVQVRLKENIKKAPTGRIRLFTGLIRCPECGCKMQGYYRSTMNDMVYYCPNHSDYRRSVTCNFSKGMHEATIENELLSKIEIFADEEIKKFKNASSVDYSKEIKSINDKMNRTNELYIEGMIDKETYNAKISAFENDLSKYNNLCVSNTIIDVEAIKQLNNKEIYDKLSTENKRSFWSRIIERIEVNSKEQVVSVKFR